MNDQTNVSDAQVKVNQNPTKLGKIAALRANPEVRKLAKTAATTALTMAIGVVVKAVVESAIDSVKEHFSGEGEVYEVDAETASAIDDVTAQIAALAKENETK